MHRYDQRVDRRADGGAARGGEGPVPGKQTLVDDDGVGAHAGDAVEAASGSSGEALPGTLQRKFESSLGADLSGVRVHRSAQSETAAQAVGARAYTLGQDVHFGAGQYDPSSPRGEHLLAHEVAHTVQQQGGLRRLQLKDIAVSKPNDAHETEADAAADAMVAGKPATVSGATRSVARKDNAGASYASETTTKSIGEERKGAIDAADEHADELSQQWKDLGGDTLLATVRSHLAAWKTFRANPANGSFMPGDGLGEAIVAFPYGDVTPALREYASRQLGPENLAMLTELISMRPGFSETTHIFNAKKLTVNHSYMMYFASSATGTTARVMYTNDLPTPWKWGPVSMGVTGFELVVEPDPEHPVKTGLFKINGHMHSKAHTPALYWGWKDFGTTVTVTGFPEGSLHSPLGSLTGSSGAGVTFSGDLGELSFDNIAFTASANAELLESKTVSVGVRLLKAGVGHASVDDECDVKTAKIATKPPVIDATKQFQVRITLFENGSSALPTSAPGEIQQMMAMIQRFVNTEFLEPKHADGLKQNGIDPREAFRPSIEVQGWASMRWIDAKTDADRDAKNLQLSEQRARGAAEALMSLWGPWSYAGLDIKGMGAGIDAAAAPGSASGAKAASDARAQLEDLQAKVAAKKKQLKEAEDAKDAVTITKLRDELDVLKGQVDNLEDLVSPTGSKKHGGNDEWIRQALIRVTWKGKVVDLGAASAPTPAPPGKKFDEGMYEG